ncbi:MAG: helix-turn-helix domain-containing protein [Armatimonadetes bacterium]|nr:helix-turn-helix domain-containing protein [Armatimonadota bacterium]
MQARLEAGLTRAEAAQRLGLHPNTVYKHETGRTQLTAEIVQRYADLYGRRLAWFYGEERPTDDVEALLERQQRELEELRKLFAGQADVQPVYELVEFPVIATVSAGNLDEIIELSQETLALPPQLLPAGCTPQNCFVAMVNGDSMSGAGIEPNSYVLVRRTTDIHSGDLVVVREGNGGTIKRYIKGEDGPLLMPDNPAYRPVKPGPDAEIVGKVELVIRRP